MSPRTIAPATAALLTMLALAGCSSPLRTGMQVSAGQEFTLQPGDRVWLPAQASLRYVGVENDSRCPPQVQCVWAGDADVKLVFEQTGQTDAITLHGADPTPQPLRQWTLALVGLEHGALPAATLRLEESQAGAGH